MAYYLNLCTQISSASTCGFAYKIVYPICFRLSRFFSLLSGLYRKIFLRKVRKAMKTSCWLGWAMTENCGNKYRHPGLLDNKIKFYNNFFSSQERIFFLLQFVVIDFLDWIDSFCYHSREDSAVSSFFVRKLPELSKHSHNCPLN